MKNTDHTQKKKYFPVFLDLSDKQIVVIGGGTIAERRVRTLHEFTSHIRVVAPEITEYLHQMADEKEITWIKSDYTSANIEDADLIIAATNHPEINHKVLSDGRLLESQTSRHILVSIADDRNLCDFYFPSIVQTEEAVIGINSGGSPKHTKELRKKIENALSSESIY